MTKSDLIDALELIADTLQDNDMDVQRIKDYVREERNREYEEYMGEDM